MSEAERKSGESFADLIGEVDAIKTAALSPTFGQRPKIRQERRIASQNSRLTQPQSAEFLAENFAQLPPAELRAMQSLHLRIVREWDFHGYFVEDARQLLTDALDERRNRQPEYWLIVHGKGRNSSPYDKAPLKNAIFELLRTHQAVAAAVSVRDSDGKSGAVAVKVKARSRRQS